MAVNPARIDIAAWLEGLGLGQYAGAFQANHIDSTLLDALTADDLKELGVASLGHRKRILAAVAERRGGSESASAPIARAAAPLTLVPPDASARKEGERRQVTILFADLCGFTALAQTLDPEDLHALVGRYAALVDGIVVAYGGSVDKHIGDAVMALFGAPIAHSDDTLRAARAAIDIHAGMAQLARDFGRELAVHLGIASGEVVAGGSECAGRAEYTVHGDAVNLAARLVSMAKPGQTLVSDAVHRAVAGHAEFEAQGDAAVKGFDKPVAVWVLRSLANEGVATRTPFVGRRLELEQFAGMLAACATNASGQVVVIRGDPGIGKTRLVGEMLDLAQRRHCHMQRALIFDFGTGKGQDAIRALVRGLLGIALDATEAARIAARNDALAGGCVPADAAVFLDDLLDLPLGTDTRALYDAMDNRRRNVGKRQTLAALVESAARRRPQVIAVEDVHWADAVTLELLAAVAIAVRRAPALLVLTSRIEGDPLGNAWRGSIAGTPLTTLDLGPLRPEEASSLASSFVSATHRVAMACIERAGGNPLFLEQLLRHAEDGAGDAVPASIRSLVLARMDLLAPADKQALQAASVLGQRFELAALHHLIGNDAYDCGPLATHALVLPEGTSYLFAHALVQEGVYSSLLKARRRDLHHRAAAWFRETDAVLHAQHLDRAEDPAAARAYAVAAQLQRESFHGERALQLAKRGLVLATGPADRFMLGCLRGELLSDLGLTNESIAAFREAMGLAQGDADQCRAAIGLASTLRIAEGLTEALAILDAAQAAAMRIDSAAELARIHHLRGNIYFPLGRIDECRQEHESGLRYARQTGSPEAEARAQGGLGDAAYAQGRMHSAFAHFERCVKLARQHGFGRIEVANRSMIGFSRLFLNELAEAREDGRAAAEAAARVGQPRAELLGQGISMYACFEMGDWQHTREYLDSLGRLVRRLGAKRFEAQYVEMDGRLLCELGQREEARERLNDAVRLCRATGMQFTGPSVLGGLARATDDPAEQRRLLDEGDALLQRGAIAHNHFWFYRDAIEVMIARKQWQDALRYADALEAYSRAEPVPWADVLVSRARALAAWHTRATDEAARHDLETVRATLAAVGFIPYLDAIDRALGGAAMSGRER